MIRWWDSFLKGAARVLDMGGTLGPTLEDIQSDEAARMTDEAAIRSDWEKVTKELNEAFLGLPDAVERHPHDES